MADIAIFRINYKSDFILTLDSDAGWLTPFCIKFWTGSPLQAYYAGYDGTDYTHCAPVDGEPTKLRVQFDDHHLPIGDLKFQIGYHFTVADFPTSVEDEVLNQASVIIEVDDAPAQVMLDLNGETAPEIQFTLPAYTNEQQRIANEEQRIAHEAIRIVNEESRISAETIRQQNEVQRIAQETARVNEFATLKQESENATADANAAATLANEKAALAADKAALADAAATLANEKAQLAADKAALADASATLANDKAALAQQKAEYAQTQGDYAKAQGDYAKAQSETAQADHERAESDHTRAESDHDTAGSDHTQAGTDHTRAESDHTTAGSDHTQAGTDHTRAESDHATASADHTQAGTDHTRAESDHTRAESDHAAVEVYVDSLGAFDISAYHATGGVLAKYADLTAALGTNGANIPDALRKGGMSVKFVLSSDSKYVQYRFTLSTFTDAQFGNAVNWQGVDDELSLYNKVINGRLQPTVVYYNKAIYHPGYFDTFSGYNSYIFDVRDIKGQVIKIDGITRINSLIFAFVTDYETIPSSANQELWDSLRVESDRSWSSDKAIEREELVPTTANYLIVTGTELSPATLTLHSNVINELANLEENLNDSFPASLNVLKLNGGDNTLKPFVEIDESMHDGGTYGQDNGYLYQYGWGHKTAVFDISYIDDDANINITSVANTNGHLFAFVKDYKTLPVKTEFDNDSSLWRNNVVLAHNAKGFNTDTVVNRTVNKPRGAKYLLVTFNQSQAAVATVIVDEGILNTQQGETPNITFSKTGHYIEVDGSVADSTSWTQSNIFELKKGQKIIFSAKVTWIRGVLLSLTDINGSYFIPVVMGNNYIQKYSYIAEKDCYAILQFFSMDGVLSITNDSVRLVEIESDINHIKDESGITPEYISKESERVYRELVPKQNKNTVIVAFNTDQHININAPISHFHCPVYALHGTQSIVDMSKRMPLDFVVFGGDIAGYDANVSTTVDGILSEINTINKPFAEINTPFVSLPGNHDAYQNNGNITAYSMYNTNYKRSNHIKGLVHTGNDNCDSYFDDDDKKIRYIFVDTWTTNGRTESYRDFLTNALSTMVSGYKALIFSHNPLTNEFAGIVKIYESTSDETGIDAFISPTDLHTILDQYADSIIACICGHAHSDAYGVSNSGILYLETTSAVHTRWIFKDNGLIIPYEGVMNTAKETSYDYYVIDLDEQTIEAVRFGQGTNRKWYYKGNNVGLIGYTNCVFGVTKPMLSLTFTNQADSSDTFTVVSDKKGYYEVYLSLGATYNITCVGYTLDTTEVTVNENTELNIIATTE